jgi:hypothetical protein
MKVQMDTGTPVIFGVLTCLTDEQALQRAGISKENPDKNHNHGDVRRSFHSSACSSHRGRRIVRGE